MAKGKGDLRKGVGALEEFQKKVNALLADLELTGKQVEGRGTDGVA